MDRQLIFNLKFSCLKVSKWLQISKFCNTIKNKKYQVNTNESLLFVFHEIRLISVESKFESLPIFNLWVTEGVENKLY